MFQRSLEFFLVGRDFNPRDSQTVVGDFLPAGERVACTGEKPPGDANPRAFISLASKGALKYLSTIIKPVFFGHRPGYPRRLHFLRPSDSTIDAPYSLHRPLQSIAPAMKPSLSLPDPDTLLLSALSHPRLFPLPHLSRRRLGQAPSAAARRGRGPVAP